MSLSPQTYAWMHPAGAIRLAVSACLLGSPVRWDGGHKHDPLLAGMAAASFETVEICPEVAAGLGVPRPAIRLTEGPGSPEALGAADPSLNPTAALRLQGRSTAAEMDAPGGGFDGAVLKSGSPSCGLGHVPIYGPRGGIRGRNGTGVFAAELMKARPDLPMIDEISFNDPARREHFFGRVVAFRRWRALLQGCSDSAGSAALAAFHQAHGLTLLSHGVTPDGMWKGLFGNREPFGEGHVADYGRAFDLALRRSPTRRRHGRVLRRLTRAAVLEMGGEAGERLRKAVEDYISGKAPRSTPLWLLRDHFAGNPHPLADGQTYLAPHPLELAGTPGGI